jgi:hypothetical protein
MKIGDRVWFYRTKGEYKKRHCATDGRIRAFLKGERVAVDVMLTACPVRIGTFVCRPEWLFTSKADLLAQGGWRLAGTIPQSQVHPVGCACANCQVAYEADARDPRDLASDERAQ